MHDPMTVAFEIKYPWRRRGSDYRPPFITIWHVDPEKDGTDDSCDWHGNKRQLSAREKIVVEAMWDLETLLDNAPHFPDSPEHKAFQPLSHAIRSLHRIDGWRYPVRWHFWHWEFQIHPLQYFKRWAFSRCCKCGNGFSWGYSPVCDSWNSTGPLWFRSEKYTYHSDCRNPTSECVGQTGRV